MLEKKICHSAPTQLQQWGEALCIPPGSPFRHIPPGISRLDPQRDSHELVLTVTSVLPSFAPTKSCNLTPWVREPLLISLVLPAVTPRCSKLPLRGSALSRRNWVSLSQPVAIRDMEVDSDRKLWSFCGKPIAADVAANALVDDKQGFPMRPGVLTHGGECCYSSYRPRRTREEKWPLFLVHCGWQSEYPKLGYFKERRLFLDWQTLLCLGGCGPKELAETENLGFSKEDDGHQCWWKALYQRR